MATEKVQLTTDEHNPSLEEQAAVQDAPSPSSEDKILGKFDSYEDLEKAYSELQSNFTKSRQEETQGDAEEAPAEEEVVREAVEDAGLDFNALSNEYFENEGLADESYESLEKAGIPREMVDSYIAGQEALLDASKGQVYNSVGGEETYTAMTEWAADNLEDAQIDAYNTAVNSGDMNQALLAASGLRAMYEASSGSEPARSISGQARASVDSYASLAQMKADMADPRYAADSAFREQVAQKLSRSNIM